MMRRHWRAFTTVCLASMQKQPRPTLRGLVFDMDGTLTVPNLDFGEMYRRCGVPTDSDILKVLASLPKSEAKSKFDIIQEMEEEAVRTMQLLPGAVEVTEWLRAHRIPTALVTRNTLESANALQEKLPVNFDIIIARDSSSDLAPKPDPAAMLHILDHWKVDPSNVVMVGDSPANDIAFGKAAKTATVLLDTGHNYAESILGESDQVVPDVTIDRLYHLPRHLWHAFDIDGELGTHSPLKKYDIPKPTTSTTLAAAQGNLDDQDRGQCHVADETGNTPLICASDAGHAHVVAKLLDYGVDLNVRGYLGATALCRAARRGHVPILKLLIQAGADLNIPNNKMQYPLHFAAFKEKIQAVHILLENGVNSHVLDRKGRIPAMDTKCEIIRETILASM